MEKKFKQANAPVQPIAAGQGKLHYTPTFASKKHLKNRVVAIRLQPLVSGPGKDKLLCLPGKNRPTKIAILLQSLDNGHSLSHIKGHLIMSILLALIVVFATLGSLSFLLLRRAHKNIVRLRSSGLSANERLLIKVYIVLDFIPGTWFICLLFYAFYRTIFT